MNWIFQVPSSVNSKFHRILNLKYLSTPSTLLIKFVFITKSTLKKILAQINNRRETLNPDPEINFPLTALFKL